MKKEEAIILMDRFYEGETTREEEGVLGAFLLTQDASGEFAEDRAVFELIAKQNEELLVPEGLEEGIEAAIHRKEKKTRANKLLVRIASVAAVAVLAVVIPLNFNSQKPTAMPETVTEAAVDYAETERILIYVSEQLERGLVYIDVADDRINEINETLDRVFNKEILKQAPITGMVIEDTNNRE